MSDECERLFSSCKILLEDRRSRLRMDVIEANECLRHSYGPPQKGALDNQEVGEVEGEPAAPLISPAQASAPRKAAETRPQPAAVVEEAWGKGFEEEFDEIEDFEEGDTPGNDVGVIEDDEIIGGALRKLMNKSDDFLESLTTSYFLNTTLNLCQDLLYIVYIYTGAPRRSWRQIVYLVDGVDLTSDPRHANLTRSLGYIYLGWTYV